MALKILHTSDWHLGKKLYKVSRLQEQQAFLKWLIGVIIEEDIEAVCLSGDVFDSPRPSDLALKTYFNFLQDFVDQTHAHLYIISGNHDSGQFLEAPRSLLKAQGRIHLSGVFNSEGPLQDYVFKHTSTTGEEAVFSLLPYFRSFDLLSIETSEQEETLDEPEQILKGLQSFCQDLGEQAKKLAPKAPHILLAHHLFGSFQEAGSEQGLFLSGLETIDLSTLGDHFDYVALGHIHRSQVIKSLNPQIRYSGSPLPFRFSENKDKIVLILEAQKDSKDLSVIKKNIPCFRPLISLETDDTNVHRDFKKLLDEIPESNLTPLCEVKCEISAPISGLSDTLREQAQLAGVELLNVQTFLKNSEQELESGANRKGLSRYSTEKLFDIFYAQKYPEKPTPSQELKQEFQQLLDEVRHTHAYEDKNED